MFRRHGKRRDCRRKLATTPSLSVVGAPKRLNLFRFVKCSSCHLRRSPEVHLGSSRGRHTKSCCAQKLQHS